MWGNYQGPPNPWGQYQPPYPPPQVIQSPVPPQVIAAFKLLENLDHKQIPIVAVGSVHIEVVERVELLPIEQKARAAALELLMAFMRSALQ